MRGGLMAVSLRRYLPEIFPAKEAKRRFDCYGKHLGCLRRKPRKGAGGGLQCGLSGSRVADTATFRTTLSWETASAATGGSVGGNPTRT